MAKMVRTCVSNKCAEEVMDFLLQSSVLSDPVWNQQEGPGLRNQPSLSLPPPYMIYFFLLHRRCVCWEYMKVSVS